MPFLLDSDQDILSGLIWVQTVCKDYQCNICGVRHSEQLGIMNPLITTTVGIREAVRILPSEYHRKARYSTYHFDHHYISLRF